MSVTENVECVTNILTSFYHQKSLTTFQIAANFQVHLSPRVKWESQSLTYLMKY